MVAVAVVVAVAIAVAVVESNDDISAIAKQSQFHPCPPPAQGFTIQAPQNQSIAAIKANDDDEMGGGGGLRKRSRPPPL